MNENKTLIIMKTKNKGISKVSYYYYWSLPPSPPPCKTKYNSYFFYSLYFHHHHNHRNHDKSLVGIFEQNKKLINMNRFDE